MDVMVLTFNLGLLQHITTTNLVSTSFEACKRRQKKGSFSTIFRYPKSVFGPRFENEINIFDF